MKMRDVRILNEFQRRIDRLQYVQDKLNFFIETALLTEWVEQVEEFKNPLFALLLQKREVDSNITKILQELYDEGHKIWKDIKLISIKLDGLDKNVSQALANLKIYYDTGKIYYTSAIYHQLRILIEYLATTPDSSKVSNYFEIHKETNTAHITGKVKKIFLDFATADEKIKEDLKTTTWGAWDNLQYLIYLSHLKDDYPQLKEWSKVFTKDEYQIYLNHISDYLFDSLIMKRKTKKYKHDPNIDFAIWDVKFELKGKILMLADYGNIIFHPEKSPMHNSEDNSPNLQLLKIIVQSGSDGINKEDLVLKTKIDSRNISSYINNINTTCSMAFRKNSVKANVYVSSIESSKETRYKLMVIPTSEAIEESSPDSTKLS